MAKRRISTAKKVIIILLIVFVFLFVSCTASIFFLGKDSASYASNQIAIVPIEGMILTTSSSAMFAAPAASSTDIISLLEKADENKNVKAIILEINSPGGTAVASKEIADKVKQIKKNKPVIAWIREVGASGAYWISSASTKIIADPLSITGSIGVISSYLEFSELMEDYGVSYEGLSSGKYKDIGSPYKKLTQEERNLLQKKLDLIHNYFVNEVSINRNISKAKIQDISNGIFYLGIEAKSLNLIDELGSKDKAVEIAEQEANITSSTLTAYEKKKTLLDLLSQLSSSFSFYIGKGLSSNLKENSFEIKT